MRRASVAVCTFAVVFRVLGIVRMGQCEWAEKQIVSKTKQEKEKKRKYLLVGPTGWRWSSPLSVVLVGWLSSSFVEVGGDNGWSSSMAAIRAGMTMKMTDVASWWRGLLTWRKTCWLVITPTNFLRSSTAPLPPYYDHRRRRLSTRHQHGAMTMMTHGGENPNGEDHARWVPPLSPAWRRRPPNSSVSPPPSIIDDSLAPALSNDDELIPTTQPQPLCRHHLSEVSPFMIATITNFFPCLCWLPTASNRVHHPASEGTIFIGTSVTDFFPCLCRRHAPTSQGQ